MSGLMAANRLAAVGHSVLIVEARDRIGGRVHTATLPGFSTAIELGAEFIHGAQPLTDKLIREAGLQTWQASGTSWSLRNGVAQQSEFSSPNFDAFMAKLMQLETDTTVNNFLQQNFAGEAYDTLRQEITRFVEGFDAADVSKASVFALRDEWSSADDEEQRHIFNGYQALADYLLQEATSKGATLILNHPVTNITSADNEIQIVTATAAYKARFAVVTIPPAVLSKSPGILPAMPETYTEALQKIETGNVIKFVIELKNPVWQKHSSEFKSYPDLHFLFTDTAIPTSWTHNPVQHNIITGWLAGPGANLHTDRAELQSLMMESLASIFGVDFTTMQAAIKAFAITDWGADPWAGGGYAYKTTETLKALAVLNKPIRNQIYLAGEAYHAGREMGTVEAALQSGEQTAKTILNKS